MLPTREEVEALYPDVETDMDKRWEEDIPHHPRSEELMRKIAGVDYYFNNDTFCWKQGGDGDNGEELMYLLDIIFEQEDIDKSWLLLNP